MKRKSRFHNANALRYAIAASCVFIYTQTSSVFVLIIGVLLGIGALASSLTNNISKQDAKGHEPTQKPISEADKIKAFAEARKWELAKRSSHTPLLALHLGGTGTTTPIGDTVYLGSTTEKFIIFSAVNEAVFEMPLKDLTSVEVSGPGTQTTNAGLVGGGLGLEGAATGIITAAMVNAATTKSSTNTFLRVATRNLEALFHFNDQEPSVLRITLSHLFVAVDANKLAMTRTTTSLPDELTKLQSLKEAGALTEEEFTSAKQNYFLKFLPAN